MVLFASKNGFLPESTKPLLRTSIDFSFKILRNTYQYILDENAFYYKFDIFKKKLTFGV